ADYYDPKNMGFSVLRVINEDRIGGGTGFGTHGHRDMEIISYVIEGALEHQDSMGNKTVIKPGEIQRMSAGTGVRHSEQNHFKDKLTHFLQIWILPDKEGYPPSYEQIDFESKFACSDFALIASPKGRDGSISLHQDVDIYLGKSKSAAEVIHKSFPHRSIWIQVIKGEIEFSGESLSSGDGAAVSDVNALDIKLLNGAEFLLFDMPKGAI
ncbi:MAG: pirin family protein, partial [Bdellovibrionales bacterium]|nr:pirin family protein [Bdellovibrionales bacterium]